MDKIIYISQGKNIDSHLQGIKKALEAGIKEIQLRLKNYSKEIIIDSSENALEMCNLYNANLFINDYLDVAQKINLSGLHLGLEDTSIQEARKTIHKKIIIGGTANSIENIQLHYQNGADYIGLGPFRYTATKDKLSPILGIEGYKTILSQCKEMNINLPIFAIGGIELDDISKIIKTGIYGIAVSSLIYNSNNAEKLVKEINLKINESC